MALRNIVTLPDPVLRKKARKVTDFGPDFQQLVEDMLETLRAAPGVGLAAPQLGILQRLIVVEYSEDEDETTPARLYVIVNPELTRLSGEKLTGAEGCLSIPGLVGEVERHESLVVKGQNRRGQPTSVKASGWLARIFQHEVDHLNGVLFVDLTDKIWQVAEGEEEAVEAAAARAA